MNSTAEREIPTFEAQCASCGRTFEHPSLGDFAYGETLLCAKNGTLYAHLDLMSAAAKLVRVVLPEETDSETYQNVLAMVADPILGQQLTKGIVCPHCGSKKLDYWEGRKSGTVWVKTAKYDSLVALPRNELIQKICECAAVLQGAGRTK